jgi:molybdate transport system substrate-binding protein
VSAARPGISWVAICVTLVLVAGACAPTATAHPSSSASGSAGAVAAGSSVTSPSAAGSPAARATGQSPSGSAAAGTVQVAAAADLQFAMQDLIAACRARTGIRVTATYGSSGNFYSQITNGAPFDVLFSADIGYPERLEQAGLAPAGSTRLYAIGRIVVWVPNASSIDIGRPGMQALLDPAVHTIAIANPEHAPYGSAAVAAMQHYGIYDRLAAKLVYGENISQTAQFVQSGAADVGILALSLALAPTLRNAGRYWLVPNDAYPAIEQGVVVLKRARDPAAAQAFVDFVLGPSGRTVLDRFGFGPPGS